MAPAVDPATPTTSDARALGALGPSVARRWAPPGPRSRARPAPLGSVAVAAMRFSAGLGRSPQIRRQLAGPASIRPATALGPVGRRCGGCRTVQRSDPVWGGRRPPDVVPDRLLRRAAGRVPSLGGHRPGSAQAAMTGKPVSVRRVPDVQFSGPMKGAASKLVPPRSGSGGPHSGAGSGGPGANGSAAASRRGSGSNGTAGPRGAVGPPGPRPGDGGSQLFAARAVPRTTAGAPPNAGLGVRRAAASGPRWPARAILFAFADPRPPFARGGPDRRQLLLDLDPVAPRRRHRPGRRQPAARRGHRPG